ncbi:hypothetical protein B0H13DRAFT_2388713 [Mycena leptocephala]|nr:hypothetical protein B0H13DRAFT_2388713 [Mycena leptocephala]
MWQCQDGAFFFHPSSSWLSSPLNTVLNGRSYVLFNLRKIQDLSRAKVSKISISKSVKAAAELLPSLSQRLKIFLPQRRRKLGLKFDSGLKPIPATVQPDVQQITKRHNPRNNLAIQFSVLSLSLLEHIARAMASYLEHQGVLEEHFGQTGVGDAGNGRGMECEKCPGGHSTFQMQPRYLSVLTPEAAKFSQSIGAYLAYTLPTHPPPTSLGPPPCMKSRLPSRLRKGWYFSLPIRHTDVASPPALLRLTLRELGMSACDSTMGCATALSPRTGPPLLLLVIRKHPRPRCVLLAPNALIHVVLVGLENGEYRARATMMASSRWSAFSTAIRTWARGDGPQLHHGREPHRCLESLPPQRGEKEQLHAAS